MILEFNIKDVYTKGIYCFIFVFFLFTRACCLFFSLSGHINQVKQNLSKTPQDLIPSVFINSWGKHKNIFYPLSWLVDLIVKQLTVVHCIFSWCSLRFARCIPSSSSRSPDSQTVWAGCQRYHELWGVHLQQRLLHWCLPWGPGMSKIKFKLKYIHSIIVAHVIKDFFFVIVTDWTWGDSSFLDIKNSALQLSFGARQKDHRTPWVVLLWV